MYQESAIRLHYFDKNRSGVRPGDSGYNYIAIVYYQTRSRSCQFSTSYLQAEQGPVSQPEQC